MNDVSNYKQENPLTEADIIPDNSEKNKKVKKNIRNRIKDMMHKSAVRIIGVSESKDLLIYGNHNIVANTYFIVTPEMSCGKFNGSFWTPKNQAQQITERIGAFTNTECLLMAPGTNNNITYWAEDYPPRNTEMFALFAWTTKFAELFLMTPTMSDPFHILWKSDEGLKLLRLCMDVLSAYQPDTYTDFLAFMKGVNFYV